MSSAQNDFSDAELVAYQAKKSTWFKGTIAVCVVYGVFAVALLAIAFMDARGRQLLSEDFLPFTITFVAGMIVVIILLVIQITTFKPQKLENLMYDRDMCPDYWKAVPATKGEIDAGANDDTTAQSLKKIKCVPDPDVFALDFKWNDNNFAQISRDAPPPTKASGSAPLLNVFGHKVFNDTTNYNATNNEYYAYVSSSSPANLARVAESMYGSVGIGTTAVRCDVVFPALMAKEDEVNNPEKPNELRCEYAKLCGVNWSSVC
jgi:hypothetical protein